jgi:exosortase
VDEAIPRRRWPAVAAVAAVAVLGAALALAYAPNLAYLIRTWRDDPNHSHGFVVLPIALWILWRRRDRWPGLAPRWWGWAAVLLVLGARAWCFERNELWLETATLLPLLAALALAFGGGPLLRFVAPGLAFLGFWLPLPPSLNQTLAGPLQRLATLGSTAVLQALGLPVLAEGNVILIQAYRLEVERACNGLSMLLSFVTLITAVVLLVARPLWERLVLLASAVPIALITNILRIVVTALCYARFGREAVVAGRTVEAWSHDAAGWAMPLIGLVLVGLELAVLSWLVREEAPEDPAQALRLLAQGPPRTPARPAAAAPDHAD